MTVRRAGVPPSTRTRSRWSSQRASVRARTTSKTGVGVAALAPQVLPRLLAAAQREAHAYLDGLPGSAGAHEEQAEGAQGGLAGCCRSRAGCRPRSAGGRTRASAASSGCAPPGTPTAARPPSRRCPARGRTPCSRRGPRSGTVWPCSMASPPHDRSSTTRALRVSGNVYRWTATFSPDGDLAVHARCPGSPRSTRARPSRRAASTTRRGRPAAPPSASPARSCSTCGSRRCPTAGSA